MLPTERSSRGETFRWPLAAPGVWFVRDGHVDVFASMPQESLGGGRRHHLCRVERGHLLFGLPETPGLIFEVIGASAIVEPIAATRLDDSIGNDTAAGAGQRAIVRWVDALCELLAVGMPPIDCAPHGPAEDVDETAARIVRPQSGVLAVELLAGDAQLFGIADLVLPALQPVLLSSRSWLVLADGATARFSSIPQLASRRLLWTALARLHQLAVDGVRHRLAASAEAERRRHATKTRSVAAAREDAFVDIATVFRGRAADTLGDRFDPAEPATPHGHLNAVCRVVVSSLGVPLVPSPAVPYRTLKEGIENIARASRFHARQITLSADWWQHDVGPLVGCLKEGSRPVALLPRKRAGYDLVDPATSGRQRVTAAVAATLAPVAFTIYRPFDAGPVGFVKLVRFGVFGCRRELLMILATGALAGIIAMGIPIATGVLINTIIPSTDRLQLAQWAVLLVVGTVATAGLQIARSIALIRLEMKIAHAVQAAVWERLLSLPSQFFRQYAAGNLATRAMGIDAVRQMLSGATIRAVLGGVFSVFNFALLFYYDSVLAMWATVVIAFAVSVFVSVAYFQRMQQREVVAIQAKTSGIILQFLTGIRKLRVAGAEMRALRIWARLFTSQRRAQNIIARLSVVFRVFLAAFPLLSYTVLFTVILMGAGGGRMRTGDFVAFLAAFTASLYATLNTAAAAIGALAMIPQYQMTRPILQAEPEVNAGQADPGPLTGSITLDHVVFRYNPDGPPVLDDVSVRIKAGEFVAFVGPSGSGKSTVLRLLLAFENPQSGAIYYDGHDFKDLDRRAVRRQIGVVLQSGRLIPGDIYTNIVGGSSATMEAAWAASRMAGFEEDIKRMPMGMHTMVTDGGGALSGGQRQRLMIARAIVISPSMLFFDEATSALDNHTQAIVSESLERLQATRIVIAHRLSTIVKADKIVVVVRGRVVQTGTYEELIAEPGAFRDLASRQLA